MKKIILTAIFISSFLFVQSQNYKIQALLTYNFTKYLTWTDDDVFKIGVFRSPEFLAEIQIIALNYKVSGKDIEVFEFNNVEDIVKCNILYVSQNANAEIGYVVLEIEEYSTVLITSEANEISEEIGINLIIVDSKQQFEIYPENIEKKNIKIDSKLLEIGIVK
ncbi:MAG: YfiR family protein [Bacteroidales bacterium]|nr:YfiR family protein [Bacteroidales bacterium]